jgi:lactoylglutathione lyase
MFGHRDKPRQSLHRRIRQLLPKSSGVLAALRHSGGTIDPEIMSKLKASILLIMKFFVLTIALLGFRLFACGQDTIPKFRINHIAIYVMDLQRSKDFYMGLLHLDSIPEPFHDNKHAWLNLGGGASLHIIEGADQAKQYFQNNHLCLSTNNFNDFKASVEAKELTYYNAAGEKGKTTHRIDGFNQLWIQDPDGYWVEINNNH